MKIKVPKEIITLEEFKMLLNCYRAGDDSALSLLVIGMLRRIYNVAYPWFRVVDYEELLQEGVSALLEYLPIISLDSKSAPITYLMLRIRSRLRDYILKACPVTSQRGRRWKTNKVEIIAQGVSLGSPEEWDYVLYGVSR